MMFLSQHLNALSGPLKRHERQNKARPWREAETALRLASPPTRAAPGPLPLSDGFLASWWGGGGGLDRSLKTTRRSLKTNDFIEVVAALETAPQIFS